MKLGEHAKLIRAKNAGPFMLTIDIIFEKPEYYLKAKNSINLNSAIISELYNISEDHIRLIKCDEINTLKISFRRTIASGDLGDTDVFGGQQHGPLVSLEI